MPDFSLASTSKRVKYRRNQIPRLDLRRKDFFVAGFDKPGPYTFDMTPEQLAELEMHLAAGTDLATALTAVQEDRPAKPMNRRWFDLGLVAGLALFLLYLYLSA